MMGVSEFHNMYKKKVKPCHYHTESPLTANFKNVVWDYFHVQYYTTVAIRKQRIE